MIDHFRAQAFRPASNLRSDLAPAAWTYFLPSLDISVVAVAGDVPGDVLEGLRRLGSRIVALDGSDGSAAAAVVMEAGGASDSRADSRAAGRPTFTLGRGHHATAQLAAQGQTPDDVVTTLAVPMHDPRHRRGSHGYVPRARRVARRVFTRLGLAAPGQDQAERSASVRVVRRAESADDRRGGVLSVPDVDLAALPAYVARAAATAGITVDRSDWRVILAGDYWSQKVLFVLGDVVVKLGRDPLFRAGLENEHASLLALERAAVAAGPAPLFRACHAGLPLVGESAVTGQPLAAVARWEPRDPIAEAALGVLASLSGHRLMGTADTEEVATAVESVVRRYVDAYRPPAEIAAFLEGLGRTVTSASLPTVFQHGDAGMWNMIAVDDGVRLLDWEDGEVRGVPTWDASAFVRSYLSRVATRRGVRPTPRAVAAMLFSDGPWGRWHTHALQRAADVVALPYPLLWPLLGLGLAYEAIKELPRLRVGELDRGRAHRFLLEAYRARGGVAVGGLR